MKYYLSVICIIVISSCFSKNKETCKTIQKDEINHIEAIQVQTTITPLELNGKAVKLIEKAKSKLIPFAERDSLLNVAMMLLDECIQKDSSFTYAYLNKAEILRKKGLYLESLEVLLKPNDQKKDPDVLFEIAITYIKLGNKVKGKEYLNKSAMTYDILIKNEGPRFNLLDGKEFVMCFIEGKEKRLVRIKKLIKDDPNNEDLQDRKMIIDHFNAEKYISEF